MLARTNIEEELGNRITSNKPYNISGGEVLELLLIIVRLREKIGVLNRRVIALRNDRNKWKKEYLELRKLYLDTLEVMQYTNRRS